MYTQSLYRAAYLQDMCRSVAGRARQQGQRLQRGGLQRCVRGGGAVCGVSVPVRRAVRVRVRVQVSVRRQRVCQRVRQRQQRAAAARRRRAADLARRRVDALLLNKRKIRILIYHLLFEK